MTSKADKVSDFLCFYADRPRVDDRPMNRLVKPMNKSDDDSTVADEPLDAVVVYY